MEFRGRGRIRFEWAATLTSSAAKTEVGRPSIIANGDKPVQFSSVKKKFGLENVSSLSELDVVLRRWQPALQAFAKCEQQLQGRNGHTVGRILVSRNFSMFTGFSPPLFSLLLLLPPPPHLLLLLLLLLIFPLPYTCNSKD
jgi:hypothetical protein